MLLRSNLLLALNILYIFAFFKQNSLLPNKCKSTQNAFSVLYGADISGEEGAINHDIQPPKAVL